LFVLVCFFRHIECNLCPCVISLTECIALLSILNIYFWNPSLIVTLLRIFQIILYYLGSVTRLKLSSHDLAIEKGRHQNIARQERVCNNCTMNILETEYHYLLTCSKCYNLRTKYIKKYYYTWPTIHKLTQLLSSK